MNNDAHDFEKFMKRREAAASAYVSGDAEPLGQLVAHADPATFFAPMGGYEQGSEQVYSRYERDAKSFTSSDSNSFEILHMAASDGIGYWVGFQRATVHMKESPKAIPFNLRITEIFRREGDDWKLIHRHADSLVSPSEENKK